MSSMCQRGACHRQVNSTRHAAQRKSVAVSIVPLTGHPGLINLLPVSIKFRSSNGAGPRRAFTMLARLGTNLVLAYLAAFCRGGGGLCSRRRDRARPSRTRGPRECPVRSRVVDVWRPGGPVGPDRPRSRPSPRRTSAKGCPGGVLAPAALLAIFVVTAPPIFAIVAWLAATGLLFGLTMRLPTRSIGPGSSVRAHLPRFGNPMEPRP